MDTMILTFLLPLLDSGLADRVSLQTSKAVLELGESAMRGFQEVGIGIASIFILFVIFFYVTALLDGGKFQMKMLWPLALYVLICNFGLVAKPTIAFTTALQAGCIDVCEGFQASSLSKATNGALTPEQCASMSMTDIFLYKGIQDNPPPPRINEVKPPAIDQPVTYTEGLDKNGNLISTPAYTPSPDSPSAGSDEGGGFFGWIKKIKNGILDAWEQIKYEFVYAIWANSIILEYGFPAIIASVLQWITTILGVAVKALGSVMTAIFIAFGPITWSFAVFPGNNRVLGSWFIRLCQYTLYGPLVALINAFCSVLLLTFTGVSGSFYTIISLLVCNIVALSSIPTLASMIIEGASGSISLSQGLQTATAALGGAASLATGPLKTGWNLNKDIQSIRGSRSSIDEQSRDSAMQHALDSIAKAVNPNYTPLNNPGGGNTQGQNPNGNAHGQNPNG